MARHKSFASENPYAEAEPVTFDLYGETFTCKAAIQGRTLLQFGKETQDDPNLAVLRFFETVMDPEDFSRFEEILDSEDKIVDAHMLGEIAGFLVGEYSTRPTVPSSSSSTGPAATGRTSGRRR